MRFTPFSDILLISFQEGSNHDRGLYARSFEELFDLSNSDATSTSCYNFSVSVFELYNEQVPPHLHHNTVTIQLLFMMGYLVICMHLPLPWIFGMSYLVLKFWQHLLEIKYKCWKKETKKKV